MNEDKWAKAYDLWVDWFEFSGDPYEIYYVDQSRSCFFCGASESDDFDHLLDCVYVAACKLVGAECK